MIIETSNAPIKAAVKLETVNPFIKIPRYQNSAPFTIRENNPKVITFRGRVNIFMIGLINILNKVKHAPTISAVQMGLTTIPETI